MDSKKIGAFIAMNRRKRGLTQEQLGERLGVTNKTVSRWENGNYMPDLSMLEPLSKELDISLNELLAGEEIKEERSADCAEKNLISAINYSVKKIKNEHKKISICIVTAGILLCVFASTGFEPESSWGQIYYITGSLLVTAGIFRELKFTSLLKKILICAGIFLLVIGLLIGADFAGTIQYKHPPVFRYAVKVYSAETKIKEYRSLFCNVFQINTDTANEYFIVDTKKEYDIDTVPVSPFNRDKSGVEHIIRYQSDYIGDNSNTGSLFYALPLSENGFVFEIDSENCGVTIDYHATDWYGNENLYTEKGMIYNSVSAFLLIKNLEYIRFNFSGSGYLITREKIEQNYPMYQCLAAEQEIDTKKFDQYVERKMNDAEFVTGIFGLFERSEMIKSE